MQWWRALLYSFPSLLLSISCLRHLRFHLNEHYSTCVSHQRRCADVSWFGRHQAKEVELWIKLFFQDRYQVQWRGCVFTASGKHVKIVNVVIYAQFRMKCRCSEFSLPLVGSLEKMSLEIVLK